MAKSKWNLSPAEIERRRKDRGMRLSGYVTEHRLPDGTHYYTVRSESEPAKQHKVEWDRQKGRWVCGCPDSQHHLANPAYRSYHCAHEHAVAISLERGTIHGVDSLQAARQRFRDGGAKEALRGMTSAQESRHQNTAGVSRGRKSTRGRR